MRKQLNSTSLLRLAVFAFAFFAAGCKGYSKDSFESIPYVADAEFVMEEGAADYSICGVNLFIFNKSEKNISSINIVFFLFDKDGEPASECRSKLSFEVEKEISAGEQASFCIPLDRYMNTIPSESLFVDYLYLAKIIYDDGSVWEDPLGIAAFK